MILTRSALRLSSRSAAGILGLGLCLYAIASAHSFFALAWWLTLVGAFAFGYFDHHVSRLWLIFILAACANLLACWWDDTTWGIWGSPNMYGTALAMAIAGTLAYRLYLPLPFLGLGLWLTQSRTAIIAAGAVCLAALWRYSRFYALLAILLAALLVVSGSHSDHSLWQRIGIWQDTILHLSLFGHGFGSFFDNYWTWSPHTNIGFQRAAHAYNDYLELIHDLGIGAGLAWAFIIYCVSEGQGSRLPLLAFAILALTFFPLWVFPCGHLAAIELGKLYRSANA